MTGAAEDGAGRRIPLALRVFGGLVVAAASGEATARLVELDKLAPPELLDEQCRVIGDLSEIAWLFGREGQAPPPGSLTQFGPGGRSYGWYDRPRWDYFDSRDCVEYRINSLGFRDEEFPLAKPANELRVIAVGDSITLAAGVRVEDCWVQQLEGRLEQARGAPVEVVNAGFSRGYRPESYAPWLAEQGVRLDPDAVVVGFCLNDISTTIPMYLPLAEAQAPWLGGRSRLLRLLQHALPSGNAPRAKTRPTVLKAKRVAATHADEWKATQDGLLAIRDLLAPRGVRFVVVVFPMMSQLASGYPFSELHRLVTDFCDANGIESVDVLPAFLGRDETELWVHPRDQHMNDVGQRIAADALAAWFAERPLAPRVR